MSDPAEEMLEWMASEGLDITRENYIAFNWGSDIKEWTPEHENELPLSLQDWTLFEANEETGELIYTGKLAADDDEEEDDLEDALAADDEYQEDGDEDHPFDDARRFEEGNVSRGQPDNAGQFGPGGYSAKGKIEKARQRGQARAGAHSRVKGTKEKRTAGTAYAGAEKVPKGKKVNSTQLKEKLAEARRINKPAFKSPGIIEASDKQMWASAVKVHKTIAPVAESLGFDPDQINYSIGYSGRAAADYDDITGEITIYRGMLNESKKLLTSTLSHEITHHKFNIVNEAMDGGNEDVTELMFAHSSDENVKALRASAGGISNYADSFWQAEKSGLAREAKNDFAVRPYETTLAINETLSEIAANLSYDKKSWKDVPDVWKRYYEDLDKAYKMIGGVKNETWGQKTAKKRAA